MRNVRMNAVEEQLGHTFKNRLHAEALASFKGREFQRLEFLGDPVLEHHVAVEAVMAGAATASELNETITSKTSDAALNDVALSAGLAVLVPDHFPDDRPGDLMEAIAGALYLERGIAGSEWLAHEVGLIAPRHPPVLSPSAAAPEQWVVAAVHQALGWTFRHPEWISHALREGEDRRVLALLGSNLIELAACDDAFRVRPDWSAYELTRRESQTRKTERIVGIIPMLGLSDTAGSGDGDAYDAIRALLGVTTIDGGANAGLSAARRALHLAGA